jgi:hypothetical protein
MIVKFITWTSISPGISFRVEALFVLRLVTFFNPELKAQKNSLLLLMVYLIYYSRNRKLWISRYINVKFLTLGTFMVNHIYRVFYE